MIRRAFSSSVFCRCEGSILLVHHKLLDLYLPIGGELEPGETPLEAAARETREETGLEPAFPRIKGAPFGTPPGFLGYEEHPAGPKGYHMNFCFLADVPSTELKTDGSWDDPRWVVPIFDAFTGLACAPDLLRMPDNVRDLLRQIAVTYTEKEPHR